MPPILTTQCAIAKLSSEYLFSMLAIASYCSSRTTRVILRRAISLSPPLSISAISPFLPAWLRREVAIHPGRSLLGQLFRSLQESKAFLVLVVAVVGVAVVAVVSVFVAVSVVVCGSISSGSSSSSSFI